MRAEPPPTRGISTPGITPAEATVCIEFEARVLRSRPGVSIGAALAEAGIAAFRHAATGDRGLFCGMGVCGECAVRVDGLPGRLACMTTVHDGMRVERQPHRPTVAVDAELPAPLPEETLAVEVLVVGGGPAGLAAAAAAAEAGAAVLLVDERGALGGQYYKQPAASFAIESDRLDAQYRAGRTLIERVRTAGVRVLSGTRVWGAAGPHELYAAAADCSFVLRPRAVVLATGAYERVVPFPGWTLPGVLTTGAGQSLLRSYQVAPGRRVLIAGNGPLNVQLAAELTRAGGTVVALAELAGVTSPRHTGAVARMAVSSPALVRDGVRYLATLRRARVPVLERSAVVRVEGDGRAERAVVARIGADGRPEVGTEFAFDVDAVCVGLGFMPGNELARLLGVRNVVDAATGGYVLDRDAAGRTSVNDVWVVGDGAEVRGAKVAQAAGELAGADAATAVGHVAKPPSEVARRRARHERFQDALWRTYSGPRLFAQLCDAETLVCRCEGVPLAAIDAALDGSIGSAGAVKRLTRTGMGHCQGRFCGFVVSERVACSSGPAEGFAGFAPQPPFRPMPLSTIAAPDTSAPK